ncbi:hypothetical protein [Glycomyces buryatensis]|uniref:Uncharacterized protein n=1 Tax=Glycomyces buryatensis TaxID=2570927 RepID=A0A4S8QMK2_9ACTN|nr:hypothetical protein [Glycomyces buryatensis]THV41954.1 hypothetical protein FAB82_08455 [Glycomyces buryatensis]
MTVESWVCAIVGAVIATGIIAYYRAGPGGDETPGGRPYAGSMYYDTPGVGSSEAEPWDDDSSKRGTDAGSGETGSTYDVSGFDGGGHDGGGGDGGGGGD